PIPCVTCNQQIKFKDLLGTARDLGAAALATGHYISSQAAGNRRELRRAADGDRDQSYFLFATTQEQLDYLRFPLGDLTKPEVRALAEHFGLEIAAKPDSQDICFVPTGRYTSVIEKLRPGAAEAGDIVHVNGHVLGRHDGIINYTIGQRRGIGVSGGAEPLYVVRLDPEDRRVVVGPREALLVRTVGLRDFNLLGDGNIDTIDADGLPVRARIRSTQPPEAGRLFLRDGVASVTLDDGEMGVATGQACVLYEDGDARARVLGGGWIATAEPELAFSLDSTAVADTLPSLAGA
ncbi:MAG: tRNA 2-thiouridine(34) synthase MnmA, partial [Hyphomicrobiaceae bacterium]